MKFRYLSLAIAFSSIGLSSSRAEARVFSFKDADLAAYMRGTGGLSAVGQEPFNHSSGTDTLIDGKTQFDYSGELGLAVGLSQEWQLRLGAEIIQHRPVSDEPGTSPAGAQRFTLYSSVGVFNPNLTLQYTFRNLGGLRVYGHFGGGYSQVTVENTYKMTAVGTTAYGVGDFKEIMVANVPSGHVGVGMETLFTDNATFSLDVGYRYMKVPQLTYKTDVQNILSPTGVAKGKIVVNADGSQRRLDLGGLVVGLTFRFYLSFL